MKKRFIPAVLLMFLCPAAFATEMAEFLDDYDEIVTIYEELANKDAICAEDNLKILTELMPKLNSFSQKAATVQGSFSSDELERYMEIAQRFSGSMMKLATKPQGTC